MSPLLNRRDLFIYMVGIGGAGMSSLAELLLSYGFKIIGSDLNYNFACKKLEKLGVKVFPYHSSENISSDINLLIYSSAVNFSNPEIEKACKLGIPCISRAEALADIARLKHTIAVAGSHGKTTVTALIGHILEEAGLSPSLFLGGILKGKNCGAVLGKGSYIVVETDESDKSFLMFKPVVTVITNVDKE
ncbi:MAG: UDP-N-acetylmuramate--L-alanine ligase, partial [Candidatus Dadabacteria bacterium]